MNSFAHYSFGAVCEWMFSHLAGIDTDGPGFRRIVIRPTPPLPDPTAAVPPISWVKARYDGPTGRIASEWQVRKGMFTLRVTIPANTTAIVHLPTENATRITESGRGLRLAPTVHLIRVRHGRAELAVSAGRYRFQAPLSGGSARSGARLAN